MNKVRGLAKYDGKCVRVTDSQGNSFEAICEHLSRDYVEHEYGKNEDALELAHLFIVHSDIVNVEVLDDHEGPWGRFSGPFGMLEIITVEDDIVMTLQMLEDYTDEEEEHVQRLLACLEYYLSCGQGTKIPWEAEKSKLIDPLKRIADEVTDKETRESAKRLILLCSKNDE